jgi:hypothetical protein
LFDNGTNIAVLPFSLGDGWTQCAKGSIDGTAAASRSAAMPSCAGALVHRYVTRRRRGVTAQLCHKLEIDSAPAPKERM